MGPMSQTEFDPAHLDGSRWPLLVLRLPGTLSAQGHAECLDALGAYVRRGEKFVLIVDLSRIGLVPLDQRWRQVEWFEAHEALLRQTVLGTALVLTSAVVRLSVSAILYFKPLPLPLATFATMNEAEAWVAQRLQEAGLTLAGKGE